jgi:hypothetical protein
MARPPVPSALLTRLVAAASCAAALAGCGSERPDGPAPEPPQAIPSAAVGARGTQLEPSRVARSLGAPSDLGLPQGTLDAFPPEPSSPEPPVLEPLLPTPPPPLAPSGTPL